MRSILFAVLVSMGGVAAQQPPQPRPPATGTGLIAGQVVDADSGQPVGGAMVVLGGNAGGSGAGMRPGPPVISDSQGRFYFGALPAGTHLALPQLDGYTAIPNPRTIELKDGARVTDVKLRLRKLGTIAGTARDDAGDPVVGTEVIAFRRSSSQGRPPALLPMARGRSDDHGRYRLSGLPVGDYYICACSRDPIPFDGQLLTTLAARPLELLGVAMRATTVGADAASLDDTLRTYAPTFHPNTTLASRATRLALAAGEAKSAVDIDLTAVKAVRVTGLVMGATGPSVAASAVRLIPAGDIPEASALTQLVPMLLQPDGRFDFAGVPPGHYTLEVIYNAGARIGGPSGAALTFLGARGSAMTAPIAPTRIEGPAPAAPPEQLWASESVPVGDADVTGLVIGLRRGITLSGRVEYVGASPQPTGQMPRRDGVGLLPLEVGPLRSRIGIGSLRPDGSFDIPNIVPGRYVVVSIFVPPWQNVRSITLRGVDITDTVLGIESEDIRDLVITITDVPAATIQGTVVTGPGEAPEEIQVRLFPADRRYWQEPFGASRRFRSARVTDTGTFTLSAIPSGEYYLVSARTDSTEWIDPGKFEELARTAERVRVADGDTKVITVKR